MAHFSAEWDQMWLDPDLDRRRARQDALIVWRRRICDEDQAPLLADLRAAGFVGDSVWDLVNTRDAYPHLITTLTAHVRRNYLAVVKEGIVRSLMVRDSGMAQRTALIEEWQRGSGLEDKSLRWALAYVISYLTPRKALRELAEFMTGDENSDHPFARRLKKSAEGRQLLAAREQELAR